MEGKSGPRLVMPGEIQPQAMTTDQKVQMLLAQFAQMDQGLRAAFQLIEQNIMNLDQRLQVLEKSRSFKKAAKEKEIGRG